MWGLFNLNLPKLKPYIYLYVLYSNAKIRLILNTCTCVRIIFFVNQYLFMEHGEH